MENYTMVEKDPIEKAKSVELINNNGSSEVYRINKIFATKTYIRKEDLYLLEHEFKITRILHSEGISVPKPFGIFNLSLNGNKKLSSYFIMEYLEGITFYFIENSLKIEPEIKRRFRERKSELEGLMSSELKKAEGLGFVTRDCGEFNTIWDWKRNKVYLIDFETWEFTKKN